MRAIILAVLLSILPGAALAQGTGAAVNPREPATNALASEHAAAPVGHRQPTLKEVPGPVRDESFRRAGQRPADPLGPVPKICKAC